LQIQSAVAAEFLPEEPGLFSTVDDASSKVMADVMARLADTELSGLTLEDNYIATNATGLSSTYASSQDRLLNSFLLSAQKNGRLAYFVEEVKDHRGNTVPRFVAIAMNCSPTLLEPNRMMNKLLLQWWSVAMKDDEGKPHQPNTCGTMFRTLLAMLKQAYGLPYSVSHFSNYKGSLMGVTKEFWSLYVKADLTFGTKPNKHFFTEENGVKVEGRMNSQDFLASLHTDPLQLMRAFHYRVGVYFALRGRKEHRQLQFSQFEFGVYPPNHELFGFESITFKDLGMLSKTNKVSLGMFVVSLYCIVYYH
jgi:hypothetical protein